MLEGCLSAKWLHNSFCLFQGVNGQNIIDINKQQQ